MFESGKNLPMNTVVQLRPSHSKKPAKNGDYRQREHLTEAEVAKLVDTAGKSRNPIRDRLMIRMAFLHALRVSELVDLRWQQIDLATHTIHITRAKNGTPSNHRLEGDELRFLRALRREHPHPAELTMTSGRPLVSLGRAANRLESLGRFGGYT
jgi:integrase